MAKPFQRIRRFLAELKRRSVYRVAVTYAVVAFAVWQAASLLFPALGFPPWTVDFVIVLTRLPSGPHPGLGLRDVARRGAADASGLPDGEPDHRRRSAGGGAPPREPGLRLRRRLLRPGNARGASEPGRKGLRRWTSRTGFSRRDGRRRLYLRDSRALLGLAELRTGRRERGRSRLEQVADSLRRELETDRGSPWEATHLQLARPLAALGRPDDALRHLRRAVDRGLIHRQQLRGDPFFADLRSDPRFREILRQMEARQTEVQARVRDMGLDLYPPGVEPDTADRSAAVDAS